MKKFPPISKDLLEYLTETFPDRCPDLSVPDRHVWHSAGSAYVVRHLRKLFEDQSKNALLT